MRTTLVIIGHVKTALFADFRSSGLASFLAPSLEAADVAKRIVAALETQESTHIAMPFYASLLPGLKMLPSWLRDAIQWVSGMRGGVVRNVGSLLTLGASRRLQARTPQCLASACPRLSPRRSRRSRLKLGIREDGRRSNKSRRLGRVSEAQATAIKSIGYTLKARFIRPNDLMTISVRFIVNHLIVTCLQARLHKHSYAFEHGHERAYVGQLGQRACA